MIPYEFTVQAERQLRKLPPHIQRQLLKKLEWFVNTPDPLRFAEPLVGRGQRVFRFRVTDYRMIFEVTDEAILITKVGRRDWIYE